MSKCSDVRVLIKSGYFVEEGTRKMGRLSLAISVKKDYTGLRGLAQLLLLIHGGAPS